MAKQVYSKSQTGELDSSAFPHVTWHQATLIRTTPIFNTTGNTAGAIDADATFVAGVPVDEIVASGSVYDSVGTAIVKADAFTMSNVGGMNVIPHDIVFGRRWKLYDVTGTGVTGKAWEWGYGESYMSIRCWCANSGPDYTVDSGRFTFVDATFGTIDFANAIVESTAVQVPYATGGWVAVTVNVRCTGAPVWTSGVTQYTLLDDPAPPRNTFTFLPAASANSITGTHIGYDVQLHATRRDGRPIAVTARLRTDEAT